MWPQAFEERLQEWNDLRTASSETTFPDSLHTINDWWFRAPMVNRYLHWDDQENWPGPWDLLADNMFCDLARALGIMYTLVMLDVDKTHEVSLVQTIDDNLVQVDQGKYILNWAPGQILNIQSLNSSIVKRLHSASVRQLIG